MHEDLQNIVDYQETKDNKYLMKLVKKYDKHIWGYSKKLHRKYNNFKLSIEDIHNDHFAIFLNLINRIDKNKVTNVDNFKFTACMYQDFKSYYRILNKKYKTYTFVSLNFNNEGEEVEMEVQDDRYNLDNYFFKNDLYDFLNGLFEIDRDIFELMLQGYNLIEISKKLNKTYHFVLKIRDKLVTYLYSYLTKMGYTPEDLNNSDMPTETHF